MRRKKTMLKLLRMLLLLNMFKCNLAMMMMMAITLLMSLRKEKQVVLSRSRFQGLSTLDLLVS